MIQVAESFPSASRTFNIRSARFGSVSDTMVVIFLVHGLVIVRIGLGGKSCWLHFWMALEIMITAGRSSTTIPL